MRGGLDECLHYGLQIERRAADDLQHIGGRGLLLKRFAQFFQQSRILDGDYGLVGEVSDEFDLLYSKRLDLLAVNRDCADQLVSLQHRHDEICPGPSKIGYCNNGRIALQIGRQGPNIFDVDHLVGSGNGAEAALRVRLELRVRPRGGVGGWHIVERNGTEASLFVKVHLAEICPANSRRVLQHLLENRLQFAGRGTDDLEDFRGCRLLLKRFRQVTRARLDFIEQPHILDGDHRLVGEGFGQFNLLCGKGPNFTATDLKGADCLFASQQRDRKNCPVAHPPCHRGAIRKLDQLGLQVVHMNWLAIYDRASGGPSPCEWPFGEISRDWTVVGREAQGFALSHEEDRVEGIAQVTRRLGQRVQHLLQIEG